MNISTTARIAVGAGLLGGTALVLAACGNDHAGDSGAAESAPVPAPGPAPGPAPHADHGSTPPRDDEPSPPDSSMGCFSRGYEIPGYTVGTARSLTSWGGGRIQLSVQDAEAGWKYVVATSCGPSDEANQHLDDYDAAMRRTIADIR
jgi:hypothetical protein